MGDIFGANQAAGAGPIFHGNRLTGARGQTIGKLARRGVHAGADAQRHYEEVVRPPIWADAREPLASHVTKARKLAFLIILAFSFVELLKQLQAVSKSGEFCRPLRKRLRGAASDNGVIL